MIALLLSLVALVAGCRPDVEVETLRPPVILISLDTLRADALSKETTPHLERLAADSVRFPSALTEVAFTLPAHMTMLTGSAPDVHGVVSREDRLAAGQSTLAEVLGQAGYATGAVVSSDWLRPGFGFGRGFESYEEIDLAPSFAGRVRHRALATLDRLTATGQPAFLFVHFYDAHSDTARRGNRRPYWAPAEESAELPVACREGACAPDGRCATAYLLWASHHADEVSAEERECLAASYLAGVRALDAGVGELLAGIDARGLYQRSLIVLTSDHGEEFGEHGQFIHGQTFHESVAIPLFVKLPGGRGAGSRNEATAQLADIAPTILGALGLGAPGAITGVDLLRVDAGTERLGIAQNKYRRERYAIQRGRWKLIHDFIDDRSRLFDREADPGELVDLSTQRSEIVTELRAALEERIRFHRSRREAIAASDRPPSDTLTPEAERRLSDLGYID